MQVALIPFLLAANISQNNDATWEHGALIKWKARFEALGENSTHRLFFMKDTFDINCVTKGEANLLCKASNFDLLRAFLDLFPDTKNKIGITAPVEITYNNHGIEQITVPKAIRKWFALVIKKIVYLLNIGVDFGEKKDQLPLLSATAPGASVECNYNYSIHEELDDFILSTDMPRQHRDYELFLIPHPKRKDGHLMTLEKHIDAMECDRYGKYFQDHTHRTYDPANSKSHSVTMTIGDRGYLRIIGQTDRRYAVEEEDSVNEDHFAETLELTLDNIEEATEPLPEIEDPLTLGLTLNDLDMQFHTD